MVRSLRSLAMLAATLLLAAACGSRYYDSSGLGAIDPPQFFNLWRFNDVGAMHEVASLTPTLVWESFPQQDDSVQSAALAGHRVEDVTYELRLRRVSRGQAKSFWPGPRFYEGRGLKEPRHTVEVPLEPSQSYRWSVRARFRLDGRERVNQWSSRTWNHIKCLEISRVPVIPDPCPYLLTTPAATP